ncbi:MAG: catalase [Methanomassiliicoccales archaeon]|nr:catalase [Methanomassiliicoccales archaeon]
MRKAAPKKQSLTDNFGKPVEDDQNTLTAGRNGPVLVQDIHLIEKLAHFDRERIPERVVHAKGAGAFGYFEVTKDVSKYTRAKFLSKVGKKTEVFVRFSTVGGEKGSADAERDPRGFAVKFYTEEGNYDMVGNNTPVFFIRDPLKFPDFIHTQKRNPSNNLKDPDMFWDFLSLTPESVHQVTILFSDRGIPATFRNMNGFTSHTYKWYNDKGEYYWIKLHFKTEQGIKNLTAEEAEVMKGKDPDHATRDLHDAIERGEFPSWRVEVQIMTPEQAEKYRFDPFDITKVWPHGDVPPMTFGRMVLNRNPTNYFAEVEQSAFSPANFVPGIGASPDKLLQGRLFSYHDTHRHRLGTNYHLIPVNQAKGTTTGNYQRDGPMMTGDNQGNGPNYYPNSFQGPTPNMAFAEPPFDLKGKVTRQRHDHPNSDFVQAGSLYSKVMNDAEKKRLISNIVGHLGGAQKRIQYRQTAIFYLADADYGKNAAKGLKLDLKKVKELAAMTQEERVTATKEGSKL